MSPLVADDVLPPRLTTIIRQLAISLLVATVIPSTVFYLCLVVGGTREALVAALAWCYGTMAWRLCTRRRPSGLLWLTTAGLSTKTAFCLATGSTYVYFLQPAVTSMLVSLAFFFSLTQARPMVARVAGDFYPMTADIAARPRVQRLFKRLTLFWAVLCFSQASVTVWLLESLSLRTFVAIKSGMTITVALAGAAVTVAAAVRIARQEHLLRPRALAPPLAA